MKKLKLLLPIIILFITFSACKYDFILPEEIPVIDPDNPTAEIFGFAEYVLPIFNKNDNCTSCHKTGGQLPDLTTEKAYSSLNSARYINLSSPELSKIYTHPLPGTSTHKHKKYTSQEAAIILAWIKQGAKNN